MRHPIRLQTIRRIQSTEQKLSLSSGQFSRFLIGMPSRKTAEPVHRDERAQLLKRTREHGFIDGYSGIRIASTGRRFEVHRATVWNVVTAAGEHVGQAAAFSEWTFLDNAEKT